MPGPTVDQASLTTAQVTAADTRTAYCTIVDWILDDGTWHPALLSDDDGDVDDRLQSLRSVMTPEQADRWQTLLARADDGDPTALASVTDLTLRLPQMYASPSDGDPVPDRRVLHGQVSALRDQDRGGPVLLMTIASTAGLRVQDGDATWLLPVTHTVTLMVRLDGDRWAVDGWWGGQTRVGKEQRLPGAG